jgi:DNA replication factor GINS
MLTYETIKKIYEEEKGSEKLFRKLARLPEDFFEQLKNYTENKKKFAKTDEEKWELESTLKLIQTIFEIRERKIVNSALYFIRSGLRPENMTPEESRFFERTVDVVKEFIKEREIRSEGKEKLLVVAITGDIPKFVGMDMQTYGPFKKGDVATLPEDNAKLLLDKKLAEAVETE